MEGMRQVLCERNREKVRGEKAQEPTQEWQAKTKWPRKEENRGESQKQV